MLLTFSSSIDGYLVVEVDAGSVSLPAPVDSDPRTEDPGLLFGSVKPNLFFFVGQEDIYIKGSWFLLNQPIQLSTIFRVAGCCDFAR